MTERAHRDPRLTPELILLKKFDDSIDDWRKLEPEEVAAQFSEAAEPEARALLATAIWVGTTQAIMQGCYWAPSFDCPGAVKVDCQHLVKPLSCVHPADKAVTIDSLGANRLGRGKAVLSLAPKCSPLDAASRLATGATSAEHHQVVVLRFTSVQDPRNDATRVSHLREDQLFLRTTYGPAFDRMQRDINAQIGLSIDHGDMIYTSGVGILRGPFEEGALWFQAPPKVDVLWIGLPARPQLGIQESYALDKDRNIVARLLDRAFACAVAHGADAVVLPPVGCGTHGCQHPSLDVAELIHRTVQSYERHLSHVCVASDLPAHFEGTWWDDFSQAVQQGRPPVVPVIAVKPILLPPWYKPDPVAISEKAKKLSVRKPQPPPRRPWGRSITLSLPEEV